MQIDLTQLIIALIGILMSMLTSVLIPYIKSKTSADQQSQIQIWANAAVQAAEQLFQGTGRGKECKVGNHGLDRRNAGGGFRAL